MAEMKNNDYTAAPCCLIINLHELCAPGSVRHCCRRAVYEMNWLGALLEWQLLLCGTLCLLHLDLPPRLILSRLD